jgi:dynein heavy chain
VGGEASGPLDEIEFWRGRSVDLSGIRTQLDDPAVGSIVSVLEYASSSYLAPFLDLRNLIHRWGSCVSLVFLQECVYACT